MKNTGKNNLVSQSLLRTFIQIKMLKMKTISQEISELKEPTTPEQWLQVLDVMKRAGFETRGEEALKYAVDNKINVKFKK